MASELSLVSSFLFTFRTELHLKSSKLHLLIPSNKLLHSQNFTPAKLRRNSGVLASSVTAAAQSEVDVEVADGYTMTQFCDKWTKYQERFYSQCKVRADAETDSQLKQKLIDLSRKVRKIDDEMEMHAELLKEIQDSPMDINAIVARRRRDFTGEFFRHLTLLSEIYDGLEDRDAIARLGTRCLSAVSAFDNTLEIVGTLDTAQEKFDDILNSPSINAACEKIKSLAKAKELDSSLILLINGAWASAKESTTMKNEVKDIMYHLYKATQSSLRSIVPKEIKLLKYLLNITDPEERFTALATAFSPGDERDIKQPNAIYTKPKELHKWIKIMLDAYHLSKEESEIREAKKMSQPVVIQRLFILKETIEEEYLERDTKTETDVDADVNSEEF
ncbi:hypothetical protein CASFOL_037208 [Castilleja foliolosa]|uniref:Uncharacterized protein n=1 Tax=Castilleja foliolosa TaxID=1961234 RepID=A0ABD3BNH1_9LAMI